MFFVELCYVAFGGLQEGTTLFCRDVPDSGKVRYSVDTHLICWRKLNLTLNCYIYVPFASVEFAQQHKCLANGSSAHRP